VDRYAVHAPKDAPLLKVGQRATVFQQNARHLLSAEVVIEKVCPKSYVVLWLTPGIGHGARTRSYVPHHACEASNV
jgi:hypothetical protein